jgi:hypothetical protein
MYLEDCPFKVVHTKGGDEVLARTANLLTGRTAFDTAERLYPRDGITPPSNPLPPLLEQIPIGFTHSLHGGRNSGTPSC